MIRTVVRRTRFREWVVAILAISCWATEDLAGPEGRGELEVGEAVLARWNPGEDDHHYTARVLEVAPENVRVEYSDDSTAWLPRSAVVDRPLEPGDLVRTPSCVAAVLDETSDSHVMVRCVGTESDRRIPCSRLQVVLRTDHGLARRGAPVETGQRVLGKWDLQDWWVATVTDVQGEAVHLSYDDGTERWVPADHAVPLSHLKAGATVFALNSRDGQTVPGTLRRLEDATARIRFFDGRTETVPLSRLVVHVDGVGDALADLCRRPRSWDRSDEIRTLRSWRVAPHYYSDEIRSGGAESSARHLEIVLALWLPEDRRARADWKAIFEELASQVDRFLERELGPSRHIDVRVHPVPVVGDHSLAWYLANLDETATWHTWQPTADVVSAVFPEGASPERHRVTVTIPDAPGIADDDSGVERDMGFVRIVGDHLAKMSAPGVAAVSRRPGRTTFSEWREDYLATTIAHEVLHTIGLPHTDGDPWAVMNIGPWYPITRRQVHVAELHELVLRSPFRSLSLSQGFARYLLDDDRSYLDELARIDEIDTRHALLYAGGPGYFRLEPTLSSFGADTDARGGARNFSTERMILQAHLASFVAFVLERYGADALRLLTDASDSVVAAHAAARLDTTVEALESEWHAWLRARTRTTPD